MREKDIIYFVSQGFIEITQPHVNINYEIQRANFKEIITTFLSRRKPEKVAIWIILLSVLLGLVLLTLLTLLLYKLGFFDRRGREDLNNSKSEELVRIDDYMYNRIYVNSYITCEYLQFLDKSGFCQQ